MYKVLQTLKRFETILTDKLIEITNIDKEWQTHRIKHDILKD